MRYVKGVMTEDRVYMKINKYIEWIGINQGGIMFKELYIEGYIPLKEYSKRMMKDGYFFVEMLSNKCICTPLLKFDDVKLLVNHNYSYEVDSISKNLKITVKDNKLYFNSLVSDKGIINKIVSGKVKGISFGFISYKENEITINKKLKIRYLNLIRLKEISLLTNSKGAYNGRITKIIESPP